MIGVHQSQTEELFSFPVSYAQFIWPIFLLIPRALSCLLSSLTPSPPENSNDPFSLHLKEFRLKGLGVCGRKPAGPGAGFLLFRTESFLNSAAVPTTQWLIGHVGGGTWAAGLRAQWAQLWGLSVSGD